MLAFRRFTPALLVLATLGAGGCAPSPTAPSHFAAFSQTDLQAGTGPAAANGDVLTIHYTLWLYNENTADKKGALVETSRGGEPLIFQLGSRTVIAGLEQGLVGLQEGGIRRLIVPPSLGYGPIRNGSIPPNATLVFEIELMAIGEES